MKVLVTMVIMAGVLAAVYRCNPTSEREVDVTAWQRNLEEEKNQAMQELNELNESIDEQLEQATSQSAKADKLVRERVANVERRLRTEKESIRRALKDVRSASENTWDDVQDDVKEKIVEIRIEVSRVREKIKNEIDTK